MVIDYKRIGRNIREVRHMRGLTQDALAEKTDLSSNHISHVEIGSSPVSLPALLKICEALEVTTDRILYDTLTQQTPQMSVVVAECFENVTPQELNIMLAVARSAKQALRGISK
jgi:transcriptional regulator with XRE-family HTH domain